MFKKSCLLASLLFILLGTNAFAQSRQDNFTSTSNPVSTNSFQHTAASVITASNNKAKTATNSFNSEENTVLLANNTKVEPTFIDYIVPGAVVLVIVFGFGGYWLIFKRKHI